MASIESTVTPSVVNQEVAAFRATLASMNRIDEILGFSSLEKARRSIKMYRDLNRGHTPRVDYSALYRLLNL
jgi:hypothetical protein